MLKSLKTFKSQVALLSLCLCFVLLSIVGAEPKSADAAPVFEKNAYYRFVAKHSGKVLDVAGASRDNDAKLIQFWNLNSDNQQFKIQDAGEGFFHIIAAHSGKVLDVRLAKYDNSVRIVQYDYNGESNQKWSIVPVGDGYYKVIARHSGKAMGVAGGSYDAGAWVEQYDYLNVDNQKWRIEKVDFQSVSGEASQK